ncbi:MAG: radical SAM protein, partial [Deltaproteobacteria bacterium]|nr:radical SAM protein [Deltaproteobacteria bacterium]
LTYMPMGLLAIADHIAKNGSDIEVVHLGVEWARNRKFDVAELVLNKPEIRAVGLSLHWHHQSYDVIEVARRIKQIRKDIFIFLGGDTASFFHDEILSDYPMIDGILRGHGEKPLLHLVNALKNGKALSSVPNLSWRDNGEVRENRMDYIGDAEGISDLNYTNFSLLRNSETYVRYLGLPFFYAKGFTMERNYKMFTLHSPMFPVPIGRGCPFNCTWCGGSHISQQRSINMLKGFIYRSHNSVIESVVQAMDAGYGLMQSAMDPEPVTQQYFIELWQHMRRQGIKTDWIFECNGLPSDLFIQEFRKTFPGPDSVIVLSPETGYEDLRMKHKGPGFPTGALIDKMDQMDRLGITSELFFTFGLPGENRTILEDTIKLQKLMRKRYRHLRAIRTMSVEME